MEEDYPSPVKFSECLDEKLRQSIVGCFVREWNLEQRDDAGTRTDKHSIAEFMLNRPNRELLERNSLSDTLKDSLARSVAKERTITKTLVLQHLTTLRLVDCKIKDIDMPLSKMANLEILSLCSNQIEDLPGKLLPRGLKFLELYNNCIQDLVKLCDEMTPHLLHLGLAYNRLDDASNLKLLSTHCCHLRTLDVEYNILCRMEDVLYVADNLPYISALCLEGNPCAMCVPYKQAVGNRIPRLLYLDNTELLEADRKVPESVDLKRSSEYGGMVITCYRLMGIPKPQVIKGVEYSYYLEFLLPPIPKPEETIAFPAPEQIELKDAGAKKGKKAKPTSKAGGKGKKEKQGARLGEELPADEVNITGRILRSSLAAWSAMMASPPIEAMTCDLLALRNLMHGKEIAARIMLQKVTKPTTVKEKKGKKEKKPDKGKKKGGDGTSERTEGVAGTEKAVETGPQVPPTERVALAEFSISLMIPAWDSPNIDYSWTPRNEQIAQKEETSLKDLVYVGRKGADGTKAGKDGKGGDAESKDGKGGKGNKNKKKGPEKLSIPEEITCHLGINLRRI